MPLCIPIKSGLGLQSMFWLHGFVFDDGPGQVFPLTHRRVRVCIPPEQVALQLLQLPQDAQTGAVGVYNINKSVSTVKENIQIYNCLLSCTCDSQLHIYIYIEREREREREIVLMAGFYACLPSESSSRVCAIIWDYDYTYAVGRTLCCSLCTVSAFRCKCFLLRTASALSVYRHRSLQNIHSK